MELEFDVENREDGYIELVPDFYLANIPRNSTERDIYEWYVDILTMENGALLVGRPEQKILNPPERVTLREIEERHCDQFGGNWCSMAYDW